MRRAARRADLALPAYDQCIKASHLFNLLDARGVDQRDRARRLYRPGARRWRRRAARPGWRGMPEPVCCGTGISATMPMRQPAVASAPGLIDAGALPRAVQRGNPRAHAGARGARISRGWSAEALAALAPRGYADLLRPAADRARRRRSPPRSPATERGERGPRADAPEQALAGFLRKHGATREQLRRGGRLLGAGRSEPPRSPPPTLIAAAMPGLLRRFPWPKSMRWGGTSAFTWVRPLRRILCLLDGAVVPFDLREGADDGHGLVAANLTEGHRFHRARRVRRRSVADWAGRRCARAASAGRRGAPAR